MPENDYLIFYRCDFKDKIKMTAIHMKLICLNTAL
jgi:hypothetical protein